MKVARNHYRVLDRGWTVANRIKDYEDVMNVIEFLLGQRGFTKSDVSDNDIDFMTIWFKPNVYGIQVKAYPSNEIAEIDHPNGELVNTIIKRIKAFNGKRLKDNVIAPQDIKYKPGTPQAPEVRFAESVNWSRGHSVIFKQTGKLKPPSLPDTITAEKIARLTPQGHFDQNKSVEDIIRQSLSSASPTEVYKRFKGATSLSNNQLNKLIYKCSH